MKRYNCLLINSLFIEIIQKKNTEKGFILTCKTLRFTIFVQIENICSSKNMELSYGVRFVSSKFGFGEKCRKHRRSTDEIEDIVVYSIITNINNSNLEYRWPSTCPIDPKRRY